jgi:hypothetical protein
MDIEFTGEIWFWKGPSPFYFVTVPADQCRELKELASLVTYGWGMIPVQAQTGGTSWQTSLFPKDGSYLVPLKASVRTAETLDAGNAVTVRLTVRR